MKNLFRIFIFLFISITFFACKKEIQPSQKDISCLVTRIEKYHNGYAIEDSSFVYDDKGKLITIRGVIGFPPINYTYLEKEIVVSGRGNNIRILLENNLVKKIASTGVNNFDEYLYNNNNSLKAVKSYEAGNAFQEYSMVYKDDNLVEINGSGRSSSQSKLNIVYSDSLNNTNLFFLLNPFPSGIMAPTHVPYQYFGKLSKNLISYSTATSSYMLGGKTYSQVSNIKYNYTKDFTGNYNTCTKTISILYYEDKLLKSKLNYRQKFYLYFNCK